jgi:hypothetical protein
MTFRGYSMWIRWSATMRRRVLDKAAREQARECDAARQRLLCRAAQSHQSR